VSPFIFPKWESHYFISNMVVAATIADENTFHRDFITRMIKLPLTADDLNCEIFIFINDAIIAIA